MFRMETRTNKNRITTNSNSKTIYINRVQLKKMYLEITLLRGEGSIANIHTRITTMTAAVGRI